MNEERQGKQNTNGQDAAAIIRAALRGRSDSELPPEEIHAFAQNYRNSMNHYWRHGEEYLEARDYQQAAEKSWGAFAASVKSIAADHGMRISFHGSIISVASALASLASQNDSAEGEALRDGLSAARSLHQHFYENDLPGEEVEFSASRVGAAIDLMQQRFSSGTNGGSLQT